MNNTDNTSFPEPNNHPTSLFMYVDKGKTYTVINKDEKYFIYRDNKYIAEVKDINKWMSDFYKKSEKESKKEKRNQSKLIKKLGYKKGVYRYLGDVKVDMIIFDGEHFYSCGWEIPLKIGDENNSFQVTKEDIGELLYEWQPQSNS